jgi:hypothetical protein
MRRSVMELKNSGSRRAKRDRAKRPRISTVAFIVFVFILSACGGGQSGSGGGYEPPGSGIEQPAGADTPEPARQPSNTYGAGQTADDQSAAAYPAFSGDTISLFGLEQMEAFLLLGEGAVDMYANEVHNEENGVSVYLTNSFDNIELFTVNSVQLSKDSDVSFNGIEIGGALKDVDRQLMDGGAHYEGNLIWYIFIDDTPYEISLDTYDDKTISFIKAEIIDPDMARYYIEGVELDNNSFSFKTDYHDLERYWD